MTVTHFIFGKEMVGNENFITFNPIYRSILASREKAFVAYLNSPYFNKDHRLTDLFQRIQKATESDKDHLRGIMILRKWEMDEHTTKSKAVLCNMLDRLADHALDFAAHEQVKTDELTKQRLIQSELRNSGLHDPLKKVLKKMLRELKSQSIGFVQLSDEFLLAYEDYYELETDREQQGLLLLNELEHKLERLYQTYKVKFTCERVNLEKGSKKQPVSEPVLPKNELLELYELNLAIHEAPNGFSTETYEAFEKAFLAVSPKLDEVERYILTLYTISALSRGQKNGNSLLQPHLFIWIKRRLEWKPGFIQQETVNDYLNTINVACCCGDLAYAKQYLEDYRSFLPDELADKAYLLGEADYLFRKQEYLAVIGLLKLQFQSHVDPHYFIMFRTKTLRIKACVEILLGDNSETGAWEIADNNYSIALDDLRIYLDRNKEIIPTEYRESHERFREIVNKIMRDYNKSQVQSRGDRQEKGTKLMLITKQKKALVAREWLAEKINHHFLN